MVLTKNTTRYLQLLEIHFQRLSLFALRPQEARKVVDGAQRERVVIPQRAPAPSLSLTEKWICITQLALVTQQIRQVVDGGQRGRVLTPQRKGEILPGRSVVLRVLSTAFHSLIPRFKHMLGRRRNLT